MSMQSFNYVGIKSDYDKLVPKIQQILSPNNPITFLDENIDILERTSALCQKITTALINLDKTSKDIPTYQSMLDNLTILQHKLSNFAKDLYHK